MDTFGNFYIADTVNSAIRKVVVSNNGTQGIISTIAGVPYTGISGNCPNGTPAKGNACLHTPTGIAVDSSGNVYVADTGNYQVRRVDATTGTISTVAGGVICKGPTGDGGPATKACLKYPTGVALDASDNLFIADSGDMRIRRVDGAGIISTVAGNGTEGYSGDGSPATGAQLNGPRAVAIGPQKDFYISDFYNFVIRRVDSEGTITTVAGNHKAGYSGDNGPALSASMASPEGLAIDSLGNIYIADTDNERVREVNAINHYIYTYAGGGNHGTPMYCGDNGPPTSACLAGPTGVALYPLPTSTPSGIGATAPTPAESDPFSSDDSNATATNYGLSGGNVNYGPATFMYIADGSNSRIRRISYTQCCTSGTLGSLLKSPAGNLYILSNEHVLGRPYSSNLDNAVPGEPISQPGRLLANKCQAGATVATFTFTPTLASNVDAAIGELISGSKMNRTGYIAGVGIPANTIAAPAVGMLVAKTGAATGLTCGKISGIMMNLTLSYEFGTNCNQPQIKKFSVTFPNQIMVLSPIKTPFTSSGDSGALVVSSSTSQPVGLNFAGGSSNSTSVVSVANPISQVLVNLAKFGQLSFAGGLPHAVPSCPVTDGTTEAMQETILPTSETVRAALAKEAHADRLMKDPAVIGVGVGASEDNPFEGVVLLLVDETRRLQAPIPEALDGVRTRVIYTKPLIPDIQCPVE